MTKWFGSDGRSGDGKGGVNGSAQQARAAVSVDESARHQTPTEWGTTTTATSKKVGNARRRAARFQLERRRFETATIAPPGRRHWRHFTAESGRRKTLLARSLSPRRKRRL
uniref:Uncharacterized protein n=1 Tax=Plectus sambesii TaxID=2011161 RepID=A0A914W175_9BILA